LTSGQSAVVLLSSGIGAIVGAFGSGWIADRIGRRKVFILTVLNISPATGTLYFTPDNDWVYLSVARFFVGLGVGGLYCVDLPQNLPAVLSLPEFVWEVSGRQNLYASNHRGQLLTA
jgi:MFS transporter, putative metabolite:H+ symporter